MLEIPRVDTDGRPESAKLEVKIRSNINGLSALIAAMGDELSLTSVIEFTAIPNYR